MSELNLFEVLLAKKLSGGGGGTLKPLTVVENGIYYPVEIRADGFVSANIQVAVATAYDVGANFASVTLKEIPDECICACTDTGNLIFTFNSQIVNLPIIIYRGTGGSCTFTGGITDGTTSAVIIGGFTLGTQGVTLQYAGMTVGGSLTNITSMLQSGASNITFKRYYIKTRTFDYNA